MSFKGRMIHFLMRYRHLLKGQLKRKVIDKNTSIEELRRKSNESASKLVKIPDGVAISQADYKELYAEWLIPKGAEEKKLILYFHGGGFVMGSA